MTNNFESRILEHLRQIRADVGTIKQDIREVKHRLSALESGMAGVKREQASLYETGAVQHASHDRLTGRVDRIERRLNLIDEPQP